MPWFVAGCVPEPMAVELTAVGVWLGVVVTAAEDCVTGVPAPAAGAEADAEDCAVPVAAGAGRFGSFTLVTVIRR